jgi:YD repeat-containing protein
MEGRLLYEVSVDAGSRWSLPDVEGRPVLAWDARGFEIATRFDALDRPTDVLVRGGGLDHVVEQRQYGEDLPPEDARARNHYGRTAVVRDQSGILTVAQADPSGRPVSTSRRLREAVEGEPDWRVAVALGEQFETGSRYDALGRVTLETLPDGTRRSTSYGLDGGIASVHLTTPDGALHHQPIVVATEHDARGERTRLRLGSQYQPLEITQR